MTIGATAVRGQGGIGSLVDRRQADFVDMGEGGVPEIDDVASEVRVAETRPIAGRRMQLFRGFVGPDDHESDPAVTVLAFGGNGGRAEYTLTDLRRFFGVARCELPCDPHGGPCGVEILALFMLASDDHLATPRNAGKVVSAYAGPKLTAHFPGHHNARLDAGHPTVAAGLGWLWGRLGFGLGGCAQVPL